MELGAVLNGMVDGVFVCDATGKIVEINRAGLRLLGASSLAEVLATAPHPYHFPNVRQEDGTPIPQEHIPFRRALAGEEVVHQLELLDHATRGTVVLRTRTAPVRDATGAIIGAVKTATDVTHEYELERIREDFIRVAAHELKTPVTVIRANAQAALQSVPDLPATERRLLEAVNRGAIRIDCLVDSLLDLVQLQGGLLSLSKAPVRLDELVAGVVDHYPRAGPSRIRITESTPITTVGDRRRLRRAIGSVVDNAVKYSPDGSAVEVSLTRRDHRALTTIRDYGVGIPREAGDRVFDKFFRAHAGTPDDRGGIGVGLFIAREIVQQHGGRIWFEPASDRGTMFHVELPLAEERA